MLKSVTSNIRFSMYQVFDYAAVNLFVRVASGVLKALSLVCTTYHTWYQVPVCI